MDPNQKIDARDVRDGGWSWFQQELLYIFRPIIGTEAAYLYMVMCEVTRQKQLNPMYEVNQRSIAKAGGQSLGTVSNKLGVLKAVGMIEVEKGVGGLPDVYRLVSLRTLAALGTAELRRRTARSSGVHQMNAPEESPAAEPADAAAQDDAESLSGRIPLIAATSDDPEDDEDAPAEAGAGGVHLVNGGTLTEGESRSERDEPEGMKQVFTKPGVRVHEKGGLCSPNPGNVFTKSDPFNTYQSIHQETTPLPPVPGGVGSGSVAVDGEWLVLPDPDVRPGDARWALNVGIAARWVLGRCGISNGRLDKLVAKALETWLNTTPGKTLGDGAALMVQSHHEYHAAMEAGQMKFGPWKPANFIRDGHWRRPASWPWKEMPVRLRDAGVGIATLADSAAVSERLRERQLVFLYERMGIIHRLGGFDWAAEQLRACWVEHNAGRAVYNVLDDRLQDIEDEMYAEKRAELSPEELAKFESAAAAKVRAMPGRHVHGAVLELREKVMRKAIQEKYGLPKLSFFYMPN